MVQLASQPIPALSPEDLESQKVSKVRFR
jgi:hypothetical protein